MAVKANQLGRGGSSGEAARLSAQKTIGNVIETHVTRNLLQETDTEAAILGGRGTRESIALEVTFRHSFLRS